MKNLALLILLFSFTMTNAQRDETIFGKSGLHLTGLWGGNTTNLNENSGNYDLYYGGHFGMEFNKALTIGWQGYKLDVGDVNMDLNGMYLGYAYRAHRIAHPTVALTGLSGNAKIEGDPDIKDRVFAIQPAVGVELNVFRWLRVGVEGGYRFVMDSDLAGLNDTDLSEPYAGIRFKFGWSWGSED